MNRKFQDRIPGMENSRNGKFHNYKVQEKYFLCEIILRKFQDNFLPGQNFPGIFNSRKRKFPERILQDSRAIRGVKINTVKRMPEFGIDF